MYQRKIDPKAEPMPMSGAMMNHKGDIFHGEWSDWVDECKNQETTKLWEWWEQANEQCGLGQRPVLHIRKNHQKPVSVVWTEDYFDLREENIDLKEEIKRLEKELYENFKNTIRPITKEDQVRGLKKRGENGRVSRSRRPSK